MTSMQDALTDALSHPIDPTVHHAKPPLQKRATRPNPPVSFAWGWGVAGLAVSLLAFGIFRGLKSAPATNYTG